MGKRYYLPADLERICIFIAGYRPVFKENNGIPCHPTLETNGPLAAPRMALKARSHPNSKLIHHSDRGIQYCCEDYNKTLENNGIHISMSSRGNPYENAIAERVNGILKTEFYLDRFFRDIEQVKQVVREVIRTYNIERPHASCDFLTPQQAHSHGNGMLRKRWKNYPPRRRNREPQQIGEEVKKVLEQLLKKSNMPEMAEV